MVKKVKLLLAALFLLIPFLAPPAFGLPAGKSASSPLAVGQPPGDARAGTGEGQDASGCTDAVRDGSAQHPYLICTPADLALLHDHPDAHFALAADLDLAGSIWTPVPSFSGTLDGQNRTIRNLQSSAGLFGTIESSGTVNRLLLVDASVNSYYGGGMLAVTNRGTVEHVDASGTVSGRWTLGGLVGTNEGLIRHSNVQGTVSGDNGVGGIAAVNAASGEIRNVRADVTIRGSYYAGGIAGTNNGLLWNALAGGAIRASAGVHGGIAGYNDGTVASSRSFNDIFYYAPYAHSVGLVCGLDYGTVTRSSGFGQLNELAY